MRPIEKAKVCVRSCRARCAAFLARRNPAEYFILLAALGLSIFLLRSLIGGTETFRGLFHLNGKELLSDFFEPIRDAAQGAGAYTERHVMYPPLGNLLLRLLGRFLPATYLDTPLAEAWTWRLYPAAILTYLVFTVLLFGWIAVRLLREKHPEPRRGLLVFFLLCGYPFLFWLERGNTVLFALPFLLFFAQTYESERSAVRELGLVALAIAFALKLYPGLFGLVLLADRRWRDAIHCVVYGLLLLLLPSFAFGGPQVIGIAVRDILSFSQAQSGNAHTLFGRLGMSSAGTTALLVACFAVLAAFLVTFAVICRKTHLTLTLAVAATLSVPSVFSSYNFMLMLVPFVLFLRKEKLQTVRDLLWFFGMALPFVAFLPSTVSDNFNIACLTLLYVCGVWELIETLLRRKREKKVT